LRASIRQALSPMGVSWPGIKDAIVTPGILEAAL